METASLLSRLQEIHASPDPLPARTIRAPLSIATLERGISRPSSPQISARFSYADAWPKAVCGITLLGIYDIASAIDDAEIQDIIACRLENWTDSPIHRNGLSRITLFGLNRLQSEEVYLVWGDAPEPEILSYIGNYEEAYSSLNEFLLFYCNIK